MKHPSASNVESFAKCGASHILPQHEHTNEWATGGTEGHAVLTLLINGRSASEVTARGRAKVAKFPLGEIMRGIQNPRAEVAYAVNVKARTVREIGVDINRNYGELAKYEIPTSLDVEGINAPRPWVRDWKFGRHSSMWQLYIQGMAMAWKHKASEVDAGFIYIDGETGGRDWEEQKETLLLMDLDDRADELVSAWDRVEKMEAELARGLPPKLHEGPWCTYCGAYNNCSAKWKLAHAMLGTAGELASDAAVQALTLTQCGQAWSKLREIKKLVEKLEDSLKLRMENEGGFPLPNGKVVQLSLRKGYAYYDRDKTTALLRTLGAQPDQINSVMKMRADSMTPVEKKR